MLQDDDHWPQASLAPASFRTITRAHWLGGAERPASRAIQLTRSVQPTNNASGTDSLVTLPNQGLATARASGGREGDHASSHERQASGFGCRHFGRAQIGAVDVEGIEITWKCKSCI